MHWWHWFDEFHRNERQIHLKFLKSPKFATPEERNENKNHICSIEDWKPKTKSINKSLKWMGTLGGISNLTMVLAFCCYYVHCNNQILTKTEHNNERTKKILLLNRMPFEHTSQYWSDTYLQFCMANGLQIDFAALFPFATSYNFIPNFELRFADDLAVSWRFLLLGCRLSSRLRNLLINCWLCQLRMKTIYPDQIPSKKCMHTEQKYQKNKEW